METVQEKITGRMAEEKVECKVYGRVKHAYSIYRKMYAQNKTLDEIFDLYAFRVIVSDPAPVRLRSRPRQWGG